MHFHDFQGPLLFPVTSETRDFGEKSSTVKKGGNHRNWPH